MVRALSTAQVQSVREINKNAGVKKANKTLSVIVVLVLVLAMLGFIGYKAYNYYIDSRFDFKDSEMGINFYSQDMQLRDALTTVMDNNNITISANTIVDDFNSIEAATEPMILLTTILSSKNKTTTIVVNGLNEKRELVYCSTNLGDLYTNTDLNKEECMVLIDGAESLISIDLPNDKLTESRVNVYPLEKRIQVKPRTKDDMMISTYLILKSNYPDLENTLSAVEAIKKKLSQQTNADANAVQDQNVLVDANVIIDSNN
ncbi:MAG: hypothetical protein WCX82_01730 [archaeon]|jgi:hypothetical protein